MTQFTLHKSTTRGTADHGWLQARHTFSFANYHDPNRMNFGALRVLNDDSIQGGMGFGMHPHDNMEIITIPLEGAIRHRDSMGNTAVVTAGEIQVMSAGTGIMHSEHNAHPTEILNLLQIWVIPNKTSVSPRYEQISLDTSDRKNKLQLIVSPNPTEKAVWIHQDAWFSLADIDENIELTYELKNKQNGVYMFIIEGSIVWGEQTLNTRDGVEIWDVDKIEFKALTDAKILLMEIPLDL